MNLVLLGLRASGKTTVGRLLAHRLGREFLDVDQLIVTDANRSIRDIFAREGEAGFRRREREAVLRVASADGVVIALGGGAVDDPQNRQALRRGSTFVWLRASAETCQQRMDADPATRESRPMLTADGGLVEIRELMVRREPIYREMADLVVDGDNREPESIAEEIERWLSGRETARGGPA